MILDISAINFPKKVCFRKKKLNFAEISKFENFLCCKLSEGGCEFGGFGREIGILDFGQVGGERKCNEFGCNWVLSCLFWRYFGGVWKWRHFVTCFEDMRGVYEKVIMVVT
ncbi:unnamed protein product [Moneuplotes crassus]|uniref:Uncharacterized protein n=1 Tax=Euplotes crassus TaxID=5936 RepID=A0AAD1XW74_EUPCR|nr:unnamed protein product [Moneuplotes crassus]